MEFKGRHHLPAIYNHPKGLVLDSQGLHFTDEPGEHLHSVPKTCLFDCFKRPRFHRIARLWTNNEDQEALMLVHRVVEAHLKLLKGFMIYIYISVSNEYMLVLGYVYAYTIIYIHIRLSICILLNLYLGLLPLRQGLIRQANTVLARASASGTKPSCQALANITWAMATLNMADSQLLKAEDRL